MVSRGNPSMVFSGIDFSGESLGSKKGDVRQLSWLNTYGVQRKMVIFDERLSVFVRERVIRFLRISAEHWRL